MVIDRTLVDDAGKIINALATHRRSAEVGWRGLTNDVWFRLVGDSSLGGSAAENANIRRQPPLPTCHRMPWIDF